MKTVADFMTRDIQTVDEGISLFEVIQVMREYRTGSLLITVDGEIEGIFTERDLLTKVDFSDPQNIVNHKVGQYMTRGLKTVDSEELFIEVLKNMQRNNIRHLPVTEEGQIVGIISIRDLLVHYQDHIESLLQIREVELYDNMKKIEESEKRFRAIFEKSVVAITVANSNEEIVSWNPFAAKLLGYKDDELMGKPVKSLYPPEEWRAIRSANIREIGFKDHLETKIYNKKGDIIDVSLFISILRDNDGKITGSICIMDDISERKRYERELIKAKEVSEAANATKTEFLANISHELRTPLHGILSYAKFGTEGVDDEPKEDIKEYFDSISVCGSRLLTLLNDLLDMSKFDAGRMNFKFKETRLFNVVLLSVYELKALCDEKSIELDFQKPNFEDSLMLDEDRMTQVIVNLISNAVKFSPEKGTITIEIRDHTDSVLLGVKDQGIGIPKEELESVFDEFVQSTKSKTGAGGTGLGLAICRRIVTAHHGKIWADANPEGGTIIYVSLPKSPGASRSSTDFHQNLASV